MRKEQPTADKAAATVEKTVTVNAYTAPGVYDAESGRAFAHDLDTAHDYTERTTNETTSQVAVFGTHELNLHYDEYTDIMAAVEDGVDIGAVRIEERTSKSSDYVRRPREAPDAVADEFADSVPSLHREGLTRTQWSSRSWEDADGEWVITLRSSKLKPRRVLAHHDRRSPDNRFEGAGNVMSAQWTINLGPAAEERIQEWTDIIVTPFADDVARNSAIQKVRIADCVTTTEKQGDCFEL